MGMGGGGSSQTVQKADPWEGVQPYLLQGVFPGAMAQYNSGGPQYYPGQTLAPQSDETLRALNAMVTRAQQGSPLEKQAQQQTSKLASGGYLNENPFINMGDANPYLGSVIDAAAADTTRNFTNATMPSIASQFALGGRYGSGAQVQGISDATNNLAKQLSSTAGSIRANDFAQRQGLASNAYQYERAAQNQGIGALPGMANIDWQNLAQLANVGSQADQYRQQQINSDISRYDYNQNLPWQQVSRLSQILQGFGGLGGTSSQTSGSSGGFLSNALGGTMLANGLYGLGSNAGLFGGGGLGGAGLGGASLFGGGSNLLGGAGGFTGAVSGGSNLFSTAAPLMYGAF